MTEVFKRCDCLEERPALLWIITQRVMVLSFRRLGTTYRSQPQGARNRILEPFNVGPIGCPETSVRARKCLLSFGAESFVFQVAIQKFKDQDI